MLRFSLLTLLFLSTFSSVHAADFDTDSLFDFETFFEETLEVLDTEKSSSTEISTSYVPYQSRWSQRQALYSNLSDRPAKTVNKIPTSDWSLRKSRTVSGNNKPSGQLKNRYTTGSLYGIASAKAQRLNSPRAFRPKFDKAPINRTPSWDIDSILNDLDEDFNLEIEITQ